jgi:hypothetical protein
MMRCYDEMLAQKGQFEILSKTVYTKRWGQNDARDIGVGQNWLSSKFHAVEQLKPNGPFLNWHHAALFHASGGLLSKAGDTKHTRAAVLQFIRSRNAR